MNKFLSLLSFVSLFIFTACNDDASIASKNISTQSDLFQIDRRIIFYNGITDQAILTIQGKCSIKKDNTDNQLEVICKVGENEFKKHYLGISDNVTYFVEQLYSKDVSTYQYKVVFKPQSIIPDIDFKADTKQLKKVLTN
ncbi:MAG: hypothetical protein KGV43_00210 [Arcobacter sp.]|nr:hypothetical protein [Arcobacter sp.]